MIALVWGCAAPPPGARGDESDHDAAADQPTPRDARRAAVDTARAAADTREPLAGSDARPTPATDARTSQDAAPAPDATAPAGKVPMFVAAGHGGRTVTSCDDGRSWIANHLYEEANVDHSPYTEKGFVYGNGVFVQLLGWGAPGSVKISRNGVDWKRVMMPPGTTGGLAFITRPTPAFVALAGSCHTSIDGETWTRCPARPTYPDNMREAGGGGPALGVGGDLPTVYSFDGGRTWRPGGACVLTGGFGNLGQTGGFAWGRELFVAVGSTGAWCQTADLGRTWKTGQLGGMASGKTVFTGGRFWAPNGADAHWSEDGLTWTRELFKPTGVKIHALARGDSGTYVGVERSTLSNRFYRSTDGVNWTLVMGPGGTSLRRLVFGYGEPSAKCPGR